MNTHDTVLAQFLQQSCKGLFVQREIGIERLPVLAECKIPNGLLQLLLNLRKKGEGIGRIGLNTQDGDQSPVKHIGAQLQQFADQGTCGIDKTLVFKSPGLVDISYNFV